MFYVEFRFIRTRKIDLFQHSKANKAFPDDFLWKKLKNLFFPLQPLSLPTFKEGVLRNTKPNILFE